MKLKNKDKKRLDIDKYICYNKYMKKYVMYNRLIKDLVHRHNIG